MAITETLHLHRGAIFFFCNILREFMAQRVKAVSYGRARAAIKRAFRDYAREFVCDSIGGKTKYLVLNPLIYLKDM